MSRRERQTNKADACVQLKGYSFLLALINSVIRRLTRGQRKSVIAEALRYEAVQGTPAVDGVDASPSPSVNAHAQKSMFSAFGEDAGKAEAFEPGRPGSNYGEVASATEMSKQCSMVHRMAEMDKTDIDPRDLHKLLPSTMLTSESLDLRQEGRVKGMDVHKLMEDQAMKFQAESVKLNESEASGERLSPTAEEHECTSPMNRRGRSASNQGLVSIEQPMPSSPVTGWPAAAVLGIMHPLNHALGHVAKSSELVPNGMAYADAGATMARLNGGVMLDWTYRANVPQQIYPQTSYPMAATSPVILEHPQEEAYTRGYHQTVTSPERSSPETSSKTSECDSDQEENGENGSKKFKSLEAALAWCHVQHSQKQVPVVPKDDVRKLVDFQLSSGKPIRAPWYRPQGDKATVEQQKPVEKKVSMAPRAKRSTKKLPKQGTGFFCPPGSALHV